MCILLVQVCTVVSHYDWSLLSMSVKKIDRGCVV